MADGVFTAVVTELVTRLTAVSGAVVYSGYISESLMADQEKVLIITIPSIEESYGRARQENCKDATLSVVISGMKAITIDSKDNLKTVLPFLEEVLDKLNTSGSTLNPQLVAGAESMGISVGEFRAMPDRVWFDVTVTIRTTPFLINNRRQI
jgi:hypothetical protein